MKVRFRLKNLKKKISKLPRILAEKSFLVFIFLFLIAVLFSLFVFWRYSISLEKEILPHKVRGFNKQKFEKILKLWQEKKEDFKKIDEKQYQNPFSF
jgi:type II secretory pathway component PulC